MPDKNELPAPNLVEKTIARVFPSYGEKIYTTRLKMAAAGGYVAASNTRRGLSGWRSGNKDPNSDTVPDLKALRGRCRDADRNIPIATGISNTKVTEVVGSGLVHHSRIDRTILGMSEEQAKAKQDEIDVYWDLFYNTYEVDAARTMNGNALTQIVYRQKNVNGAALVIFPRIKRSGSPFTMKIQMLEVDRLVNKGYKPDSSTLSSGIKMDKYGAPVEYQIMDQHPGSTVIRTARTWSEIPAFGGKTGLKNVIHYFQPQRPGQAHGVPDFAPILELLRTLGAYTSNEALAAEISSLFTIFIESDDGNTGLNAAAHMSGETGASSSDSDVKLGPGLVMQMKKGEKITEANPLRPNTAFDAFVLSVSRQLGAAVNLPYEVLIKHFTASYSAARASLLTAWKYFLVERQHLADNYCQQVKNVWMWEAVSMGLISAPGFFTNHLIRKAYCNSIWTGPAKGQIDEKKEIEAAKMRIELALSTAQQEAIELNNSDYYTNLEQRSREIQKAAELNVPTNTGSSAAPVPVEIENKGSDLEE